MAIWAADCAGHVLSYFEGPYPGDDRPRKAIEAARLWANGRLPMVEARKAAFASHTAAREANNASAKAAARAAGHAAATAHAANHARHAAAYAVKAAIAAEAESDWQVRHLPKHLRAVAFPSSKHEP